MASYHMPATYSIRVPMTSPYCGKALPTPGPATVQLAMIRAAIELYGLDAMSHDLLPHFIAASPKVQPPDQVAISNQLQRAYKADDSGKLIECAAYREYCHCEGPIRVFVLTPPRLVDVFATLLTQVGYWGQRSSFACCTEVIEAEPRPGWCATKISTLCDEKKLQHYFAAFATEIEDSNVKWTDLVPRDRSGAKSCLRPQLYVWPLVECEQRGAGRLMRFCSLL